MRLTGGDCDIGDTKVNYTVVYQLQKQNGGSMGQCEWLRG